MITWSAYSHRIMSSLIHRCYILFAYSKIITVYLIIALLIPHITEATKIRPGSPITQHPGKMGFKERHSTSDQLKKSSGSCIRLSPACSLGIKKALQNPALKNRGGACEVKTVTIDIPESPKTCRNTRNTVGSASGLAKGTQSRPLVRTGSSKTNSRQFSSRRLQKRAIGFAAPWKYRHIPYFIWDGRDFPVQADCASNPEDHAFETWRESFFKDLKRKHRPHALEPNQLKIAQGFLNQASEQIFQQTKDENFGIRFYPVKNPFQLMYSGVQVLIVMFSSDKDYGETFFLQESNRDTMTSSWQAPPFALMLSFNWTPEIDKKSVLQVVMHELFHVLGGMHEHQRPDRDQHLRFINTAATWGRDGYQPFYEQQEYYRGYPICSSGPYDIESISHYSLDLLIHDLKLMKAMCNIQEIANLVGPIEEKMGKVAKLSKGDLAFLKAHFGNKKASDDRKLKIYKGG